MTFSPNLLKGQVLSPLSVNPYLDMADKFIFFFKLKI